MESRFTDIGNGMVWTAPAQVGKQCLFCRNHVRTNVHGSGHSLCHGIQEEPKEPVVIFQNRPHLFQWQLHSILMSVGGALGTYMYADVLGSLALMSVGSMVGMPVSLVCMSVVPKLARKIGSQKVLRVSLLIGCALYVGLFTLHITTDINVWVHIGINALASGISGLSNMMQWGMLSEAIEYNEYLTGKRTEGSINGTFNMLRRLGQGLGASFGVAMLGMIGYNAEVTVQTAGTILGIKVLCLLFPAICAVGSWIVFRFVWNITPELREKMAQKRAAM